MSFIIVFVIFNQYPKQTNPIKIVFNTTIKLYQKVISPAQGDICNFYPSCSHFAGEAIEEYGVLWGTLMASDRLMRCNPNAINYYDTYYSGIKHGKIYDPVENNYIFSPIRRPSDILNGIME
ncbi:MAG: membrane protein insertion efficiency factor YidD [candidate division WOR-3 bacterium]